MKKLALLGVVAISIVSLSACSSNSNSYSKSSGSEEKTKTEQKSTKKSNIDKFENQQEIGTAKFDLQTASGDTANGKDVVLFYNKETIIEQISYSAENFDGAKKTFIYIDGTKNTEDQLGEMSQGTLNLENDALKKGIHKVEAVQYDNDTEKGKITTFKVKEYTIK